MTTKPMTLDEAIGWVRDLSHGNELDGTDVDFLARGSAMLLAEYDRRNALMDATANHMMRADYPRSEGAMDNAARDMADDIIRMRREAAETYQRGAVDALLAAVKRLASLGDDATRDECENVVRATPLPVNGASTR